MRFLWTLLKIAIGLCLILPLGIIVLATALGLFGALLGLAMLTLRFAIVGLVIYGAVKLLTHLFRDPAKAPRMQAIPPAAPVDPYYEAAKRELDRELGHTR